MDVETFPDFDEDRCGNPPPNGIFIFANMSESLTGEKAMLDIKAEIEVAIVSDPEGSTQFDGAPKRKRTRPHPRTI